MTRDVGLGVKQGLWEFHVERTGDPLGTCMNDDHSATDRCSVSTSTTFQAIPHPRVACIWTAPASIVRCLPMMGSDKSYVIPKKMMTSATPADVAAADAFAAAAAAQDQKLVLQNKAKLQMVNQLAELATGAHRVP
jgi:hypothetical protein